MFRFVITLIASFVLSTGSYAEDPFFESGYIFDPEKDDHGHVHASCIVECPNGDLRAIWYENGEQLPPPYYNEDRDKRDDVRIGGARKPKGADAWETPFVMADTFGCSDNNPCMVVDSEDRLWMFYPTLIGVPEETWGSSLLQFKISEDYDQAGPPVWKKESILVPKPAGIPELFEKLTPMLKERGIDDRILARIEEELKDPFKLRLGWMPRAHPLIRLDGSLLLPVSNENFNVPVMCMTNDEGETWTYSEPVPYIGLTQPTVVEWEDKALTAFFRGKDNSPKISTSESKDGGKTWSKIGKTDLIHPGSGLEAIVLDSGNLAVIYNDVPDKPRDRLAIALSDDRGKTWKWKRTIEDIPDGRFDYPSIVQAKDGSLHATYSYNLETIKHVRFNEAWAMEGD